MKKLALVIAMVLVLGSASACAGDEPPGYFYQTQNNEYGYAAPSESLRHSFGLDSGTLGDVFLDLGGGDGDPLMIYSGPSEPGEKTVHTPSASGEAAIESIQRMIVRTGEMSLVVEDVESAIETIGDMAEGYEGYVVAAESWQEGKRMVGTISIRVGAAYYEQVVSSLRDMAVEVKSQSTSGEDVTEEYVDLESALNNLRAGEEQLLELMDRAGTVEEILGVQKELSSTRGEIERTSGRMQFLEQSSATSLINIRLEHSLPAAEFAATSRIVKEGERVWFRPEVSGGFPPYSYEWDFGDGETSRDEQARHEYRSDDTYTVSLTVTDDRGNTDTFNRESYMTVLPGWSFAGVVGGVWDGMVVFGKVLLNILIGIGISSPVWVVILVVVVLLVRRRRKKAIKQS